MTTGDVKLKTKGTKSTECATSCQTNWRVQKCSNKGDVNWAETEPKGVPHAKKAPRARHSRHALHVRHALHTRHALHVRHAQHARHAMHAPHALHARHALTYISLPCNGSNQWQTQIQVAYAGAVTIRWLEPLGQPKAINGITRCYCWPTTSICKQRCEITTLATLTWTTRTSPWLQPLRPLFIMYAQKAEVRKSLYRGTLLAQGVPTRKQSTTLYCKFVLLSNEQIGIAEKK